MKCRQNLFKSLAKDVLDKRTELWLHKDIIPLTI